MEYKLFAQKSQKEGRHSKTLAVRLASTSTELGGEGVGDRRGMAENET